MSGATLFRRNGPSWRFEWDAGLARYVHRTRRKTLYAIMAPCESRGIWIGREWRGCWFAADVDIGAEYIQFDDETEFWFRNKHNET